MNFTLLPLFLTSVSFPPLSHSLSLALALAFSTFFTYCCVLLALNYVWFGQLTLKVESIIA